MSSIPYAVTAKFGYNCINDKNPDEIIYLCPECIHRKGTPDTKGHLYINTKTLQYYCFRCGYSGKLSYTNIDTKKVYEETLIDKATENTIKNLNALLDPSDMLTLKIPIDKVTTSKQATNYLLERGFTYEQMEYYDMRVGSNNFEFGRIVIPNRVERMVYTDMYSARTYIGQVPKYHNPSQVKKSEIVFNLHRINQGNPIILVEGALTAIAAGYYAVASLGKVLSESQAAQIAQKKPAVVYVNYDYGAEKENEEACALLYKYLPHTPIFKMEMPDERDAADLSHKEYFEILRQAKRYNPLVNGLTNLFN